MFKALGVNQKNELEIDNFDETFIESLEHSIEVQTLRAEIRDLISTGVDLEQLYVTIEKNGISAGLLAFANRNNVLSKHIPGVPSLESLTVDISAEDSKAALEGIADVIKQIYKKTIGKITALISHMLTSLKIKFRSIPAMRMRIDSYVHDTSGKVFDEEKAHKITGRFVKYEQLLELIDHAKNANSVILELLRMELPTTEEGFVKFKKDIEEFKQKHGQNYRFGSNFKYDTSTTASLLDKGYNAESFHAIAAKLDEYIRMTISSNDEAMKEWYGYEEKVEKVLETMSATYKDGDGTKQTAYTKIGHMLLEVTDDISQTAFDIDKYSFRDGPVKALKTLNLLKQAYK